MARPRKNIIDKPLPDEQTGTEVNQVVTDELPLDVPPENEAPIKKSRKPRETKTRASKVEKNILADQLCAGHKIAALVSGIRELELGVSECEALALAITDVMVYHDIIVDPKTAAYINLLTVAGMVYLPRGYAIYQRRKGEKQVSSQPAETEKPLDEQPFEVHAQGDKIQPVPSATLDITDELLDYDTELESFE